MAYMVRRNRQNNYVVQDQGGIGERGGQPGTPSYSEEDRAAYNAWVQERNIAMQAAGFAGAPPIGESYFPYRPNMRYDESGVPHYEPGNVNQSWEEYYSGAQQHQADKQAWEAQYNLNNPPPPRPPSPPPTPLPGGLRPPEYPRPVKPLPENLHKRPRPRPGGPKPQIPPVQLPQQPSHEGRVGYSKIRDPNAVQARPTSGIYGAIAQRPEMIGVFGQRGQRPTRSKLFYLGGRLSKIPS